MSFKAHSFMHKPDIELNLKNKFKSQSNIKYITGRLNQNIDYECYQ